MGASAEVSMDDPSRSRRRRVLVLFGNIPLSGQERGNIQVFHALRHLGVDALFITNRKWGGVHVQPFLDSLGLKWIVATFGSGFRKGMTFRNWIEEIGHAIRDSVGLVRTIRKFKPTHIHLGNVRYFMHFLPVLVLTKVPLIYRVGDVPALHRSIYRMIWTRLIAHKVSRFVCVSEYIRSSILALGVPKSKCTVIYSEPPVRRQQGAPSLTRMVEKGRPVTVLYVGQLSSDKGVAILVSAAIQMCQSNDNLEFLLAGDYRWENPLATGLRDDVRAADLSERIRFLGYVDAVHELFQLSDLHVLPSVLEDALPNVVIEAKQAGVASIVFASGGVPEIIEHEHEGYICTDRTKNGLVAGIEYYVNCREKIRIHGANARASYGRLGIDRFAELWNAVYAEH